MSELRKKWSDLKAAAKKAGYDVEKDVGSQKLGSLLDKVATAEAAYEKGMAALAQTPDKAKEKALKKAVLDAITAALKACTEYSGIVKRTEDLMQSGRSGLDANQARGFAVFAVGVPKLLLELHGLEKIYKP